jgi:hypothetical protein
MFREKVRLAWQNGIITDEEYLLALQTGVLTVEPGPGRAELMEELRARLAGTKTDQKAYQAVIDELLKMKNSLTHIAVHIKSMGQMKGATVEVAVAEDAGGRFLIAGLNSTGTWTPEQVKELEKLGIKVAPQQKWKTDSEVEGKPRNQPHAEENILWQLALLNAKPLRFSNAPVGEGKPDSDVCPVCRRKIRDARASIEPGMHDESPAPKRPQPYYVDKTGNKWVWDASTDTWTKVGAIDGP